MYTIFSKQTNKISLCLLQRANERTNEQQQKSTIAVRTDEGLC